MNCAIDWQLFTGMKKPLRTVATCHTCARQVVLRGGLTPAGFRFETLVTEQPALALLFLGLVMKPQTPTMQIVQSPITRLVLSVCPNCMVPLGDWLMEAACLCFQVCQPIRCAWRAAGGEGNDE